LQKSSRDVPVSLTNFDCAPIFLRPDGLHFRFARERKTSDFRPSKLPLLSILYSGVSWRLSRRVFSSPLAALRGPRWGGSEDRTCPTRSSSGPRTFLLVAPNTTRPIVSGYPVIRPRSAFAIARSSRSRFYGTSGDSLCPRHFGLYFLEMAPASPGCTRFPE
jgi:hypothetical protein